MKKIIFLFLLSFVFLISCGGDDDSPVPQNSQSNSEDEQNDQETPDTEKPDENTQEEEQGEPDVEETPDVDNEPEQPEEDQNTPQADPIGNFNLNFSGQIITQFELKNIGGQGKANFMYNNTPFTYSEIKVLYSLFPLAMANSGNIIIMWIDGLSMNDISGATEKQVFGIAVPQNAEAGSGNMKDINSYAFFGKVSVNVSAGQFEIKCVNAVSDRGEYNITANDGANITLTANGDLFDPSLVGNLIPYPACTE